MTRTLALAAALALAGGALLAQPMGGAGPGQMGMGPMNRAGLDAMFTRFDADKDGKITAAEIAAWRKARLAEADADKDGKLSAAEFAEHRAAEAAERARLGAAQAFARVDGDGDGFVAVADLEEREPMMLRRLDANGDGAISRDEAASMRGRRFDDDDDRGRGRGRGWDDDDDRPHRMWR